jgi:hypothetical protein
MSIFSFSPYLSSAPAKTDQKTEKTSRLAADLGLNNFRNWIFNQKTGHFYRFSVKPAKPVMPVPMISWSLLSYPYK